jgi:hypothetical protein
VLDRATEQRGVIRSLLHIPLVDQGALYNVRLRRARAAAGAGAQAAHPATHHHHHLAQVWLEGDGGALVPDCQALLTLQDLQQRFQLLGGFAAHEWVLPAIVEAQQVGARCAAAPPLAAPAAGRAGPGPRQPWAHTTHRSAAASPRAAQAGWQFPEGVCSAAEYAAHVYSSSGAATATAVAARRPSRDPRSPPAGKGAATPRGRGAAGAAAASPAAGISAHKVPAAVDPEVRLAPALPCPAPPA